VDVCITSPPYNIGTAYNVYDDVMPMYKYLDWTADWIHAVDYALKEDGSFFLNIGSKPSQPETPFRVLDVALRTFKLQNTIHWIKSVAIDNVTYGHYKPINSYRFVNDCHEYIFHLTKTCQVAIDRTSIGVPYVDKSNIGRYSSTDIHCRGNTWFIPYETIQMKRNHPAQFPRALPSMCIRLHGRHKTHLVMDPFAGSGTTESVCKVLKIDFIGFEIDESYK